MEIIHLLVFVLFLGAEVEIESFPSYFDAETLSSRMVCFNKSLHRLGLSVDDEEVILTYGD